MHADISWKTIYIQWTLPFQWTTCEHHFAAWLMNFHVNYDTLTCQKSWDGCLVSCWTVFYPCKVKRFNIISIPQVTRRLLNCFMSHIIFITVYSSQIFVGIWIDPSSTVTHKWPCWAIVTIPFVWSLQNFSPLKPILGKFGLMASWLKYTESMNKWVQMVMKQCNVVITDMRAQLIFVWEFPWYQSVTLTFIYCYPFRSEKLLHISVLKL